MKERVNFSVLCLERHMNVCRCTWLENRERDKKKQIKLCCRQRLSWTQIILNFFPIIHNLLLLAYKQSNKMTLCKIRSQKLQYFRTKHTHMFQFLSTRGPVMWTNVCSAIVREELNHSTSKEGVSGEKSFSSDEASTESWLRDCEAQMDSWTCSSIFVNENRVNKYL